MLFVVCWSTGRNRLTAKRRWLTDRPSKISCRSSGGCDICHTFATLTSRSSAAAGVQMLFHTTSRQAGTRVHLCVLVHEFIHPAKPAHAHKTAAGRPLKHGAVSSDGAARKKSETVFSVICHLEGHRSRVCGGKRLKDSGSFTPGAVVAWHHLSSCVNKQSDTFPSAGPLRLAHYLIIIIIIFIII